MRTRVDAAIIRNLIVLTMMMVAICASAQDKRFRSITTKDGLPQNSVDVIVQDSLGFIWIGTQDGLARYDSYEMQVFRNEAQNPTSLSDNFITSLLVDSQNGLWVGTRNGLNYFDGKSNTFKRFLPKPGELHQAVYSLFEEPNGVRASILGKDYYFDFLSQNAFLTPKDSVVISDNGWIFHQELSSGTEVSLGSDSAYIIENGKAFSFALDKPWLDLHDQPAQVVNSGNDYWILCKGVWHFNTVTSKVSQLSRRNLAEMKYLNGFQLIEDELWIATDVGLMVVSAYDFDETPEVYTHDPSDEFSINYNYVHSVYQDKSGLVWIGTANKGLNYFDPKWENLHYLFRSESNPMLPHPLVWCATKTANNQLWVGTAEGMALFNSSVKKPFQFQRTALPKELEDLESIRDLVFDENEQNLWIASGKSGLMKWNFSARKLENYSEKFGLNKEMVDLEIDESGRIWAGSYFGMYVINDAEHTATRLDTIYTSAYTMDVFRFDEQVFISHSRGVAVFDESETPILKFEVEAEVNNAKKLPFSIASSVAHSQGSYWVGLYDVGVAKLDAQLNVKCIVGEKQGLLGHVVEAVIADNDDNLWVSTNQGVSVFEFSTDQIFSFGEKDGLRAGEFALGAAFKDSEGFLYFGSVDGLLMFDPEVVLQQQKQLQKSRVRLSKLEVNYADYRLSDAAFANQSPDQLSSIELYRNQRVVSFEFSALQFNNADQIEYHYQMLGFDDEPVKTGANHRIATYSNLPPGAFTLVVNAFYKNGALAAEALEISVIVHPPFYAKWWFRLLILAAIIILVAASVRYYSFVKFQRKLAELKTKERILKERERISRDLHDSVGSQLTYMIGSLDNLAYKSESVLDSENMNELSDFARGTMQQLREAIWVINKDAISLYDFRLKLEDHCAKMLVNSAIEWQVSLFGNVNYEIEPGTALHIFRICQESIHNTVKHAQAKKMDIVIKANAENSVELVIKDDGVGFDISERKMGHYGLDNINERVQEMGGKIAWKSERNKGTEISILLKVN
ncbi:MAG: histidine kinase [Salibacteraceae bacterium]|nr:histidine kinase [Salibacteraceae bacterium]